MNPDIQRIAEKCATDLFTNGQGEKAERLKLILPSEVNGGGWCHKAVRDTIEKHLNEYAALRDTQERELRERAAELERAFFQLEEENASLRSRIGELEAQLSEKT